MIPERVTVPRAACRSWQVLRIIPLKILRIARLGKYIITKQIDQIARTDVVIFDDFGLQHLDGPARLTLLEVLEDRVGRRSTVFASQLPVDSWFQVIGDATIADAICDRLIHHSVRIDLQGESLRKPQAAQEVR